MNERGLTETLHRIAEQAPAVRLPEDLWRRGRRLRRRRMVALGVAVAVCVVALAVPMVDRGDDRLVPAGAGPAVPAVVYPPLLGQATARESPPGPAAILVSGEGALRGTDAWGGYVGRSLLVSRDGKYRLVRTRAGGVAGSTLLLSPDGRYVAGDDTLEGVSWPDSALAVLDLTTGKVRRYPAAGLALAWTPDGRGLLVHERETRRVSFLALDTGEPRTLLELGDLRPDRDLRAAFSPEGGRVAVQIGETLHLIDLADGSRSSQVEVGSHRLLAGSGAWLPDGRRVAVLNMAGCATGCADPGLDPHTYQVRYLDAGSGIEVAGPPLDDVVGVRPRLLGWQSDGSAVVVQPGSDASKGVELVAMRPGGGSSRLVDLPAEAWDVDVPRDLVDAGAFGGPSPSAFEGRLRGALAPVTPVVLALGPALVVPLFLLLVVVVSVVSLIRRRRLRRLWSRPEAPPPAG